MKTTMDWDKIAQAGATRKGKKGNKFVSRLTGKDANGERPSLAGKVRGLKFRESFKFERGAEISVQTAKDGSFFFQARIKGKFGKRHEISASLAAKLA